MATHNLYDYPDRSNCVSILNQSKKVLFAYGEGFCYEFLPAGSRLIYPPPPDSPIEDVNTAIAHALEHPTGCDPLAAQLQPGMKVTIAFDDISLPVPLMTRPDLRELIITQVLDKLATAGVSDIHLIGAIAFHRKMMPQELKRLLGNKIFKAFYPDRLYNHDAEDPENNVYLGTTEQGEVVELNRRVAESDLVIYVNINIISSGGGSKSFATGLTTYRTLKYHHNFHTLMHSRSYMDPPNSALHHSCDRMGKIIEEQINIFKIETTVNNNSLPRKLPFLRKPIWDYTGLDKLSLKINKLTTDILPTQLKRPVFNHLYAPYQLTGIEAGKSHLIHRKTLKKVYHQQVVPVDGQADILVVGIPHSGPYNVHSIMNPILVMCQTLGYAFNFYRGKPVVRKGGVIIALHPLYEDFHAIHHPSYIEFYERVLWDTIDPKTIETKYEAEFAQNPKYIDLYRNHYAFHGVHPFYMWYWSCHGMSHVSKVIFVRPRSKRVATRLGCETAKSLAEAIEKAKAVVGDNPKITNYQLLSGLICDVS
jgi:hypothetical protein